VFRNIAVTTDFTEASRLAFGAAAHLSRKFQARLYLLNVARSPAFFTPWQIAAESPAQARKRLLDCQQRLQAFAAAQPAFQGMEVLPEALPGESAEAIVEYQRKEKIDLTVIATHGDSGVSVFPLGSFAARLLQLSTSPVLVFRTAGGGKDAPARFEPRRILAPHDFSRPSAQGLEVARHWARTFGAQVRLISVVKPELHIYGDSILTEEDLARKSHALQIETQEMLQQVLQAEWKGIRAEAHARVGNPALEIIREAAEYAPDLIIMASRGRSVVSPIPLGSVAERTIHGANCPVLVVK